MRDIVACVSLILFVGRIQPTADSGCYIVTDRWRIPNIENCMNITGPTTRSYVKCTPYHVYGRHKCKNYGQHGYKISSLLAS
jgi:hypothetical protein